MSSSARAASVGCGLLALFSAADAFTAPGSLKMSLGAAAPGESSFLPCVRTVGSN